MPTVTGTIIDPDGTLATGPATFRLVGSAGRTQKVAHLSTTGEAIQGASTVDLVAGAYSIVLPSNDLLLPAGTRWARTHARSEDVLLHVTETPSTQIEDDILADPPGTLASAALDTHAADTTLHGGGLQLFAAHKSDGTFATTSTAPVAVTGWSGSMTVPARPFEVTAVTSMFTGDASIPSHLAVYARIPVTAADRTSNVVTLTVPTGHGIQPGVVPLVDLADNNYDLTTDVGVPGNAITSVTATTVVYSQTGANLGTSTGFIIVRVGITASVKGIGQAVALAIVPNVLWQPSSGLAVTFLPHVRTDNASSSATIISGDLGGFGNGPNYAVLFGRTL